MKDIKLNRLFTPLRQRKVLPPFQSLQTVIQSQIVAVIQLFREVREKPSLLVVDQEFQGRSNGDKFMVVSCS